MKKNLRKQILAKMRPKISFFTSRQVWFVSLPLNCIER